MININKSDDINYRYKMPSVSFKLGGAGNGIFTIINNLDEISIYINTPSEILYKYISYVYGSSFNEKKKSITGHHKNIQDILFDYIDEFVICKSCGIPELSYELEKINSKNFNVIGKCSACGSVNIINSNNKINNKCIENITKYLIKEKKWINNKGFNGTET
jgi:translation initiation factor 5